MHKLIKDDTNALVDARIGDCLINQLFEVYVALADQFISQTERVCFQAH